MEEQERTSYGQGLGIAGLILGILAIPLGIIPCTFVFGLVFGVTGIVLGAVAYTQAKKANGPVGLAIGALTVSIVGTCIALIWTMLVVSAPDFKWVDLQHKLENIDKAVKKTEEIDKAFESFDEEMEDILEDLEENDTTLHLEIDLDESLEGLSEEERARKLGKAAGKAVKEFIREVRDTAKSEE
ncbi:MAG: DUF4190 domain-containing protein [Bacteroidales bacterium]|nr:DUF4190 domain-containing protein [Bacteroidales bacterium]